MQSPATVLQAKTLPDVALEAQAIAASQGAQLALEEAQPVVQEAARVLAAQAAPQAQSAPAEQPPAAVVSNTLLASPGNTDSPAVVSGPAPSVEPSVGHTAPDFALSTLDGQQVRLSDLKGKNVLLNYWVTWCIPCLQEMPAIQKLYQEYEQKGLVVLSVNGIAQDELSKVTQTVAELGLTYPVVLDEGDAIYKSYWVSFMPTSFFIDEQGIIRQIKLGGASEEEFRTMLDQLLADQL